MSVGKVIKASSRYGLGEACIRKSDPLGSEMPTVPSTSVFAVATISVSAAWGTLWTHTLSSGQLDPLRVALNVMVMLCAMRCTELSSTVAQRVE